jgi:hypothetical protein
MPHVACTDMRQCEQSRLNVARTLHIVTRRTSHTGNKHILALLEQGSKERNSLALGVGHGEIHAYT